MSIRDAVLKTGPIPPLEATRAIKKRYSELLSRHLAIEVGEGLRRVGFSNVKPSRTDSKETAIHGGLGPKKIDVCYSDERHGLLLAVSIKTINFPEFGKNLKNRFADLCTEAITLHMRFPYSVVCALFGFPTGADLDITTGRKISTFRRAMRLFATISGREDYTDPAEKFENVTMLLYDTVSKSSGDLNLSIFDAISERELTETEYFRMVLDLYNKRNPHAAIGLKGVDW